MALTGTPLINDIEDFRAIWQFLGWIDDKKPLGELMDALEETGLTPGRPGLLPGRPHLAWWTSGIVRRRKVDVAADIPARRVADLPVELDDEVGPLDPRGRARPRAPPGGALRERAGDAHVRCGRRRHRPRAGTAGRDVGARGHDHDARPVTNVFTMMRRIGQAKAGLAADYTAQLARNVGKVVFFAKHVDVMDVAEETFARRGIRLLVDPR